MTSESTTDAVSGSRHTGAKALARLNQRKRAEKRFRACGVLAIVLGIAFVATLFTSIVSKG